MVDTIDNLIQIMRDDLHWQEELASVLENKLDAMRHYDMTRLEALTANEQRITNAIASNEAKRQQAIRQATRQYLPKLRTRPATARELAQVVDESRREKLMAISSMLKTVVEKAQRFNRINAMVSQKVMGHFSSIFEIIAQSGHDIGLYGRAGKKTMLEQHRLVDAIA